MLPSLQPIKYGMISRCHGNVRSRHWTCDRGIDADVHSHSQKQETRWLDKINIKTYSAPEFNISVNCHNFSESKVKVETGGQKLSHC